MTGLLGTLAFPEPVRPWLLGGSLVLLFTGVVFVAAAASSHRIGWRPTERIRRRAASQDGRIDSRWIDAEPDVDIALRFVAEVVEELEPEPPLGIARRQTLRQNLARNSRLAWGVFQRTRQGGERLVGLLIAYPITARAVSHLDNERITGSAQLLPEFVCTSNRRPAGYYVSFVGGYTPSAQALVMADAERRLRSTIPVYTRPISRDGRRAAARLGFEPIGSSAVWRRAGSEARVPELA